MYQPETRPEPVKKGGVLVPILVFRNLPTGEKFHTGAGRKVSLFGSPQMAGPRSSPPVRHALFDECVMEGPVIRALIAAAVPWLVRAMA